MATVTLYDIANQAVLKKTNQRLLDLADFLETVPKERFDMGVWKCGSSACALGWAATYAPFKKEGLRLAHEDGGCDGPLVPTFDGRKNFDAAQMFFAISFSEAQKLFGGFFSTTPAAKAKQIRAFVKRRKEDDVYWY